MEKYLISVGIKRALAAGIGALIAFMGTDVFVHALSVLQGIGITVTVDKVVFQKEIAVLGGMAVVALHDWAKVRFPQITWL